KSRLIWQPKGSSFGGCTSHHHGTALRGNADVYDEWYNLGNHEWSYEKLLPFFKKFENRSQINKKISESEHHRYFDPAVPSGHVGSFDKKLNGDEGPVYL